MGAAHTDTDTSGESFIGVRVDPALKREVTAAAEARGWLISNFVRAALRRELGQRGASS